MLYLLLAPLLTILGTIFFLRCWAVLFTDNPVTKFEEVIRSFVNGFREGYGAANETTVETMVTNHNPSNEKEYETLTLEIATSMADELIADAWSEAKAATRSGVL
jgi:hypothetical protein